MIEFSEMRGPNKIFGSFCEINEPNILYLRKFYHNPTSSFGSNTNITNCELLSIYNKSQASLVYQNQTKYYNHIFLTNKTFKYPAPQTHELSLTKH